MKLLSDLYNITLKRGIESKTKEGFIRPTIGEHFMSDRDFEEIISFDPNSYIGHYYQEGDEKLFITDGWVIGLNGIYSTPTKEEDYLRMRANGTGDGMDRICSFSTNNKINLENIDTLYIDWYISGGSSAVGYFIVAENRTDIWNTGDPYIYSTPIIRTQSILDVSNISGSKYIICIGRDGDSSFPQNTDVRVYNIWS